MVYDLKQELTNKIRNIVQEAIKQLPVNAEYIRLTEGYRQSNSGGFLNVTNCWTEVEAIYYDKDNNEVSRVPTIDKNGGWKYSDPANYILYQLGYYQPYNKDDLKSIKQRYEWNIDHDMMHPIYNITSDNYNIRQIISEIINDKKDVERVILTFVLDYNYMKNAFPNNVHYDKREYSIRPRITINDKKWTFTGNDCRNFFENTLILEEAYIKLKEQDIPVQVNYDMNDNDWEHICSHWNKWWIED